MTDSAVLQIRNVPDADRRVLKARAAAQGESLNSYLLSLINRDAARPTASEVFERAARRSERSDVSALDAITSARAGHEAQRAGR